MPRTSRPTALLAAAALLAGVVELGSTPPGAAAAPAAPAAAAAAQVATFNLSWARQVTDGADISTTSPVIVDNGGNPIVITGDLGGWLRAFRLRDGAPVPGWENVNAGYEVKAPLSTDGTHVYVPVAQDYKDNVPKFNKYDARGRLVWSTAQVRPQPPGVGFLLAGMTLAKIKGRWKAIGASSGHWIYQFDGDSGRLEWAFRNADSTMATPIVADVYGTGVPQVITSNDKTAEFPTEKNGGHIRIFTTDGRQVCSADQPVEGNTHAYSGYNNSSPALAEVDGRPLIVFGSTGPVQTGAGGNQLVAYDHGCKLRWASAPLVDQVQASPTFADVLGRGTPQVLQVVGVKDGPNRMYPRVYVLDASTGRILLDTGASLRAYGAQIAYPPGVSIATADVNGDGAQDLFVPASDLLVLDGKSLRVLTQLELDGALQNTPVITAEPGGGVRVTFAGYQGNSGPFRHGSLIRSYVSRTASLGKLGWHRFGQNSQLTGVQGQINGPYDSIMEGQGLRAGRTLRSGGYQLAMQSDGQLVVRRTSGTVIWSTRTRVPGSRAKLSTTGRLQVLAPNGRVLWQTSPQGPPPALERLVLGANGKLRILSGRWDQSGSERTMQTRAIWGN
jgi:hypothetical protein